MSNLVNFDRWLETPEQLRTNARRVRALNDPSLIAIGRIRRLSPGQLLRSALLATVLGIVMLCMLLQQMGWIR
jgi:hypothetical protein